MSPRTCLIGPVLFALSLAPGCAQREMRAQAAALAEAGARLESETAEFTAARSAVVRLRQRNLIERRQQIAEQGQFNARQVHFWKIATDPDRARRLALFDGVVAASAAAAEVHDRPDEWEESVLARAHALTIDRAALHRLVQQLLILASPPRFLESARFYAEFGAVVGKQVGDGLKEVQDTVACAAAAQGAGDLAAAAGGDRLTAPANPGDPRPGDARPGDPQPGDPKPGDPKPGDPRPGDMRVPTRFTPP